MKTPNFIVVGAHKAGTTSLHQYLDQHPEIYLPPRKGLDLLLDRKVKELDEAEDYLTQFEGAQPGQVIGEVSSVYLQRGQSIVEKIKYWFPDVKIIAVLRNPVDRAYSHALWENKYTKEEMQNLEQTIINSKNFKKRYLFAGLYYTHLQTYFSCFDKEQVKILLYDDFSKNPQKFFAEFYDFVGVNKDFSPDVSKKFHSGSVQLSNSYKTILDKSLSVNPAFKQLFPKAMRSYFREMLWSKTKAPKKSMSNHFRLQLIDYFRDEVMNLQELTGLQLSHWLEIPEKLSL